MGAGLAVPAGLAVVPAGFGEAVFAAAVDAGFVVAVVRAAGVRVGGAAFAAPDKVEF